MIVYMYFFEKLCTPKQGICELSFLINDSIKRPFKQLSKQQIPGCVSDCFTDDVAICYHPSIKLSNILHLIHFLFQITHLVLKIAYHAGECIYAPALLLRNFT